MIKRSVVAWISVAAMCVVTLIMPMAVTPSMTAQAATEEVLMGDLDGNGSLNMLDETMLYRYVGGLTTLTVAQIRVADVNGDGVVSMLDVVGLYNVIAGKTHTPTDPTTATTSTTRLSPIDPIVTNVPPTHASVSMTTVTGFSTTATTSPTMLKGIDVSYAQGKIDWKVAKSEIDFAILRCGYGQDDPIQDDTMWETNAAACEELGIPYGAYFFCYARTPEEAYGEAMHALRLLDGKNLTYPVFYDLEYSSWQGNLKPEEYATIATIFCEVLKSYGFKVGIYSNLDWWKNRLTAPCFDEWYRWVAQYNDTCDYKGYYHMWQYSDRGVVDGIDGNTVDMNYTYTDFSILT